MTGTVLEQIKLSYLLAAEFVVWAVLCVAVHGPAILCYVAFQAATSGVFAYAIHRSYQQHVAAAHKQKAAGDLPPVDVQGAS